MRTAHVLISMFDKKAFGISYVCFWYFWWRPKERQVFSQVSIKNRFVRLYFLPTHVWNGAACYSSRLLNLPRIFPVLITYRVCSICMGPLQAAKSHKRLSWERISQQHNHDFLQRSNFEVKLYNPYRKHLYNVADDEMYLSWLWNNSAWNLCVAYWVHLSVGECFVWTRLLDGFLRCATPIDLDHVWRIWFIRF